MTNPIGMVGESTVGRICAAVNSRVISSMLHGEPDARQGGRTRSSHHHNSQCLCVRSLRTHMIRENLVCPGRHGEPD